LSLLDEGSAEAAPATDLVGQASRALSSLARIDHTQEELANQAAQLEDALAELTRALRLYLDQIEYNPERLEEVEERLNLIHNLTHKYGGDIPAVLSFGADARKQLEHISTAGERIGALVAQEDGLLKTLAQQGQQLSEKRKAAAAQLGKQIEIELDDLKMAAARFGVEFRTRADPAGAPLSDGSLVAFDQDGLDRVEFLVAPNPGEGLKPLVRIASGGETSRLMLALKNILARADQIPSLIFDEIDQGIGGRVGLVVGYKLWHLARNHQVFCVTHLPQLAAFGDEHYQVQKLIQDNRTLTRVERLEGEPRLLELSQMLGEVGEGTLRSAHELTQVARQMIKNGT
jgi:DNA repair protein RecN (Recombination protein N)